MKKHNFKIGDRVFDIRYGWLIVTEVEILLPVGIIQLRAEQDDSSYYSMTYDYHEEDLRFLSFVEYPLEGVVQERLKEEFKVGDIGYFFHDYNCKTCAFGKLIDITHNNRYQISSYNSHGSYQYFSLTPPDLNY